MTGCNNCALGRLLAGPGRSSRRFSVGHYDYERLHLGSRRDDPEDVAWGVSAGARTWVRPPHHFFLSPVFDLAPCQRRASEFSVRGQNRECTLRRLEPGCGHSNIFAEIARFFDWPLLQGATIANFLIGRPRSMNHGISRFWFRRGPQQNHSIACFWFRGCTGQISACYASVYRGPNLCLPHLHAHQD